MRVDIWTQDGVRGLTIRMDLECPAVKEEAIATYLLDVNPFTYQEELEVGLKRRYNDMIFGWPVEH